MIRRDDWRSRLSACIGEALQRPFEWGVHDCALFAADAVLAMTGEDPAEAFRGRYRTQIGAARVLHREGFKGLLGLAQSRLNLIPAAMASDGDLIAIPDGLAGETLGVVAGALIAAPGPDRLEFIPRTSASFAFHVPFAGEAV